MHTANEATCSIVRTRCDVVDDALRGGVRTKQITELVGEAGSAKTQLCAQLCLSAQIDLRECSVVYVQTDGGKPPTAVMRRIARSKRFVEAFGSEEAATGSLERVYIVKALGDARALWETLVDLSAVLRYPADPRAPVRMIVIDSVAAPFRDGDEDEGYGGEGGQAGSGGASASGAGKDNGWAYAVKRAGLLHKMTMLLKEYATLHDLAVVVTNHVVDSMRGDGFAGDADVASRALGEAISSGRRVLPALGVMWGNCVNTRLFLTRYAKRSNRGLDDADEDVVGRRLSVVFAPHLAEATVEFTLRDDGVWSATPAR
jgi:DNA-repair protein XRCC3